MFPNISVQQPYNKISRLENNKTHLFENIEANEINYDNENIYSNCNNNNSKSYFSLNEYEKINNFNGNKKQYKILDEDYNDGDKQEDGTYRNISNNRKVGLNN